MIAANAVKLSDDKSNDESSKKCDAANEISSEMSLQFPSSRQSRSTTFAIEMSPSEVATNKFLEFAISEFSANRKKERAIRLNDEERRTATEGQKFPEL
jgi:hypothetical protein